MLRGLVHPSTEQRLSGPARPGGRPATPATWRSPTEPVLRHIERDHASPGRANDKVMAKPRVLVDIHHPDGAMELFLEYMAFIDQTPHSSNVDRLMDRVLRRTRELTEAEAGTIFIVRG